MKTRTTIKIIKKKERDQQIEDAGKSGLKQQDPRQKSRDIVSTVSDWVNEFQQKRRTDTKMAFKALFPDPPRTTEA